MTTTDHPAWPRALERFRDAYGSEFDPTDSVDIRLFVELLEGEVRTDLISELVEMFNEATAKIEQTTTRMLSEQGRG